MKKDIRAFKVFTIKQGTVIDHINAGQALKIISILKLNSNDNIVTVGLNFPSKALKYKDLIKVEGRELNPDEANRVAILAPQATINIIRNFEVVKKFKVQIPEQVEKLITCPNPKCITNNEAMKTIFYVSASGQQVKLKCRYCEKTFDQSEIKSYNV
jgi:aspartate carbamoyltransferase regulatory subunit